LRTSASKSGVRSALQGVIRAGMQPVKIELSIMCSFDFNAAGSNANKLAVCHKQATQRWDIQPETAPTDDINLYILCRQRSGGKQPSVKTCTSARVPE
jgi:hypothetical protein